MFTSADVYQLEDGDLSQIFTLMAPIYADAIKAINGPSIDHAKQERELLLAAHNAFITASIAFNAVKRRLPNGGYLLLKNADGTQFKISTPRDIGTSGVQAHNGPVMISITTDDRERDAADE